MSDAFEKLDPFNVNPNVVDSPDLDGLFASQKRTAMHAIEMVETACMILADHHAKHQIEVDPEISRKARHQRAHIEAHRRLPHNPKLPQAHLRLGSAIDRALWQGADLLIKAIDLAETPARLEKLRKLREAKEQARQARIEERRAHDRRAAAAAQAAKPVKMEKRPKREPEPRCEKCGKRPPVLGKLCKPCAQWEARHG